MHIVYIPPSYEILAHPQPPEFIEKIARVCYKSEKRITKTSHKGFLLNLKKKKHLSVFEHTGLTVKFVCDRGVSHQIVRHRIASFTQESTRYCNYKDTMYFIIPSWLANDEASARWKESVERSAKTYEGLINLGWAPQQARAVLPTSLKTELVITANIREWLLIFQLRTAKGAHPQTREIVGALHDELKDLYPDYFC